MYREIVMVCRMRRRKNEAYNQWSECFDNAVKVSNCSLACFVFHLIGVMVGRCVCRRYGFFLVINRAFEANSFSGLDVSIYLQLISTTF